MDGPRRVVLVGFMAAGKSTVGRRLAERLGYSFVDLDEEVERLSKRTIPELFDEGGEAAFRRMEEAATAALDETRDVVIAAGGGWMARPELRDRWPDAVRVWLRVGPQAAWERVAGDLAVRPMLDSTDPEGSLRSLMRERDAAYRLAELSVNTDRPTPEETAELVADLLAAAFGSARAAPRGATGERPRQGSSPPLSGYREPERGETETEE